MFVLPLLRWRRVLDILQPFERGVVVVASRAFKRMLLLQAHHRDSKEIHCRRVIAYAPNLVLARHPRCIGFRFRRVLACIPCSLG